MSEHELEKLLGGFAADTLTEEERKILYTAALQDQQLFNALADEQALKELLADPVVRRRLLQALNEKSASGIGGSLSWLDWFRKPAGLAYAGGLAAAALAVLLGTKIYQDSLNQAARSVSTEELKPSTPSAAAPSASQPAPPSVTEPQYKAKENEAPAKHVAKKDAMLDKLAKRERSAPPQEQGTFDAARDSVTQRTEQDEVRRQAEAPVAALGKSSEKVASSADQNLATSSIPPATAPTPAPMQTPASAPAAGAVRSGPSARALFYQTTSEPAAEMDRLPQMATEERSPGAGAMAEAPQREKKRAEQRFGVLGRLQGSKRITDRPLGIRYSVIMAGPGGINMEVDPTTPVGKDDAPRLAIQTNEDGFLSVLSMRPSSDQPTVLFPPSGDGRIVGRKTIAIALEKMFDVQQTTEQARLLVIFSRMPHAEKNPKLTDKKAPHQLIEQVDPSRPGAPTEQAVYVVTQDPSLARLSVEISLRLR